MPDVKLLPSPRVSPYAGENTKALMSMMQILGQAEVARRRDFMTKNVLEAISRGAGREGISEAALMDPGFSGGIGGALQRVASPFARQAPGIEDIIAGRGIESAFETLSPYEQIRAPLVKAQTEAIKARTKQELPDRMLRQADRYLRIVDDVMSEYWYTPEGPYKDKLLKDAQSSREKAMKLIEKYGASSESGKASIQQINKLDEEIKRAGGKVKSLVPFGKPQTKEQFDKIYQSLKSPQEKQAFIDKNWRPEFGRHLK